MEQPVLYKFRLYIAGDALNSIQATANLAALCREYLPGRHEIELVDVFLQPKRALEDGIFMSPTLLKLAPLPLRRLVGTLSEREPVLLALALVAGDP